MAMDGHGLGRSWGRYCGKGEGNAAKVDFAADGEPIIAIVGGVL